MKCRLYRPRGPHKTLKECCSLSFRSMAAIKERERRENAIDHALFKSFINNGRRRLGCCWGKVCKHVDFSRRNALNECALKTRRGKPRLVKPRPPVELNELQQRTGQSECALLIIVAFLKTPQECHGATDAVCIRNVTFFVIEFARAKENLFFLTRSKSRREAGESCPAEREDQ